VSRLRSSNEELKLLCHDVTRAQGRVEAASKAALAAEAERREQQLAAFSASLEGIQAKIAASSEENRGLVDDNAKLRERLTALAAAADAEARASAAALAQRDEVLAAERARGDALATALGKHEDLAASVQAVLAASAERERVAQEEAAAARARFGEAMALVEGARKSLRELSALPAQLTEARRAEAAAAAEARSWAERASAFAAQRVALERVCRRLQEERDALRRVVPGAGDATDGAGTDGAAGGAGPGAAGVAVADDDAAEATAAAAVAGDLDARVQVEAGPRLSPRERGASPGGAGSAGSGPVPVHADAAASGGPAARE
jgi:regulator of replication initiation timing